MVGYALAGGVSSYVVVDSSSPLSLSLSLSVPVGALARAGRRTAHGHHGRHAPRRGERAEAAGAAVVGVGGGAAAVPVPVRRRAWFVVVGSSSSSFVQGKNFARHHPSVCSFMSSACGGWRPCDALRLPAGVERRVRGHDGGDGVRVDDDAGQRRPGGQGEAGSQAQGTQTACGAQEVRCFALLYGCSFRAAPFPSLLYVYVCGS